MDNTYTIIIIDENRKSTTWFYEENDRDHFIAHVATELLKEKINHEKNKQLSWNDYQPHYEVLWFLNGRDKSYISWDTEDLLSDISNQIDITFQTLMMQHEEKEKQQKAAEEAAARKEHIEHQERYVAILRKTLSDLEKELTSKPSLSIGTE